MYPKTFEEACSLRGYDAATILPDVSAYPEKHQRSITAFAKLIIITEAINNGREPEWNNDEEEKWYPLWDMEMDQKNPSGFRLYDARYGYAVAYTAGGSRLYYRTKEDCEYSATQFIDLWRDMMIIPTKVIQMRTSSEVFS